MRQHISSVFAVRRVRVLLGPLLLPVDGDGRADDAEGDADPGAPAELFEDHFGSDFGSRSPQGG